MPLSCVCPGESLNEKLVPLNPIRSTFPSSNRRSGSHRSYNANRTLEEPPFIARRGVNSTGLAELLNELLMGLARLYCIFNAWMLFAAASILVIHLGLRRFGQKLLQTVVAAKVERLSIAFGAERRCFIHGHPADGVFGYWYRSFHVSFSSWWLLSPDAAFG